MATADVAKGLVELCRAGKFEEAMETYYSANIVSTEPFGDPAEVSGIEAVRAKGEWWNENFQVNECIVEGPYVNNEFFAVRFQLDTTNKKSGERSQMDEIAVYTVKDDKIVQERFFYNGG